MVGRDLNGTINVVGYDGEFFFAAESYVKYSGAILTLTGNMCVCMCSM